MRYLKAAGCKDLVEPNYTSSNDFFRSLYDHLFDLSCIDQAIYGVAGAAVRKVCKTCIAGLNRHAVVAAQAQAVSLLLYILRMLGQQEIIQADAACGLYVRPLYPLGHGVPLLSKNLYSQPGDAGLMRDFAAGRDKIGPGGSSQVLRPAEKQGITPFGCPNG